VLRLLLEECTSNCTSTIIILIVFHISIIAYMAASRIRRPPPLFARACRAKYPSKIIQTNNNILERERKEGRKEGRSDEGGRGVN